MLVSVAIVGVNRHATVEGVAALARAGVGGAVCCASGFLEAGDGGAHARIGWIEAAMAREYRFLAG